MQTPHNAPKFITLVLITALSTLSLNMFLPSLANMASDFNASYATVSLSIGGYLAATAVVQLVVGSLSDRIGRRPVMLVSLAVFALASAGCAIATNIWVFLFCRLVQASIITGYAVSLAIVRDTNDEREAASQIGYISMAMAIAPIIGPTIGGTLDTFFGWRSSFFIYALSGTLLFLWCWKDLGETLKKERGDMLADGTGTFVLIKEPLFLGYALCSAFSTGAFYIFLTGAPLVAQNEFGVTTAQLGVYIGSITVGFMVGGFVSGRLASSFSLQAMMLAGRLIACCGLAIGLIILSAGQLTPLGFFGCTVFVGLGNGITMPSASSGAMSVRPELAGNASGLTGALIVSVGAVLTTLAGRVLPEDQPAMLLMILMFTATLTSLLSAIFVALYRNKKQDA